MRLLAISSAGGEASVACFQDDDCLVDGRIAEPHGLAAALPALVARLLSEAGGIAGDGWAPELVAVSVGPGSFTGLRAGMAVAHGLALGFGVPVVGVTVAEAFEEAASGMAPDRDVWTAIEARRGRVFVARSGDVCSYPTNAVPMPAGPVAVCGNAANVVAASLAARGCDVMLTSLRQALPRHVARVAARRRAGDLPPLAAVPQYVDAPEARLPSAGLRAAPGSVAVEAVAVT